MSCHDEVMRRLTRRRFLQTGAAGVAGGFLYGGGLLEQALASPMQVTSRIHHARNGTAAQNVAKVFDMAYGGIDAFIGPNDVVLLRPNLQWPRNGYTNTLVGKALIDLILNRPGGFNGEIIIVENQHRSDPHLNANSGWCTEDTLSNGPWNWFELVQYYVDHADAYPDGVHVDPQTGRNNVTFQFLLHNYDFAFADPHPTLPTYSGASYGGCNVQLGPDEAPFELLKHAYPNKTCLYVRRSDLVYSSSIARVSPLKTEYQMSYPVFKSQHSGLYVSLYQGHPTAWDPETESFVDAPVKLINMSTLNHHGWYAGVTSIVKAHFGLCYNTFHHTGWQDDVPRTFYYAGGAVGYWMGTIRHADLHMSCAERVGRTGRLESNAYHARSIAISNDPVALDYYVGKYVLFPAGGKYGVDGTHATEPDTNDPSLSGGYYGLTLDLCRDPLADHSIINGTLDETEMDVIYFEHAPGDMDSDGDVDMHDLTPMQTCTGADISEAGECAAADLDGDGDVDSDDFRIFEHNADGPRPVIERYREYGLGTEPPPLGAQKGL